MNLGRISIILDENFRPIEMRSYYLLTYPCEPIWALYTYDIEQMTPPNA